MQGLGLGVLAAGLAIYLHFVIVPDVESKELALEIQSVMMNDEDVVPIYWAMAEESGRKIEYGEYTLLLGALAFLVSVYPAIKRNKFFDRRSFRFSCLFHWCRLRYAYVFLKGDFLN